jgi:hypothetical protein
MSTRLINFFGLLLGLILVCAGLASCASLFAGVRQDTGSGTPALLSTATSLPTVPAGERGSTYAYIAGNQLWIVLSGVAPQKITSFDDSATPNVYWHTPAWSPDDHYLAVIVSAQPANEGGGGCPGPQFGANGALYLLNTTSLSLSKLTVPADSGDALARNPQNGYWQAVFWQDASHLLAWYNGAPTANSARAGLYRYDLGAHTLTRVLTLSSMGLTTLFNQQAPSSAPLLLGLRYSQGYLYYQEVLQPYTASSRLLIRRISLARTGVGSQTMLIQGQEGWCASPPAPYVEPGWDIASHNLLLVAQVIDQNGSRVETFDLASGKSTPIFTHLPATASGQDLTLAWSPSAQIVAAAESHAFSQDGPFCATLAQPESLLSYTPAGAGQIAWRPDGQAFTLQDSDLVAASVTSAPSGPYMYQVEQSDQQGTLLLIGASDFAWG